jgi:hypothetical protein
VKSEHIQRKERRQRGKDRNKAGTDSTKRYGYEGKREINEAKQGSKTGFSRKLRESTCEIFYWITGNARRLGKRSCQVVANDAKNLVAVAAVPVKIDVDVGNQAENLLRKFLSRKLTILEEL